MFSSLHYLCGLRSALFSLSYLLLPFVSNKNSYHRRRPFDLITSPHKTDIYKKEKEKVIQSTATLWKCVPENTKNTASVSDSMFFGVSYSLPSYSLPSYSLPLFLYLTPSLPQPVKLPGWKVHTYKLPNSIFDGQIANRLSILCILTEVLSHAHAKRRKGGDVNGFKFTTFIGRFRCDGPLYIA